MNLNINLKMKDSFKNSASVSKVTLIVDTCSLVIDHARRAQTATTGQPSDQVCSLTRVFNFFAKVWTRSEDQIRLILYKQPMANYVMFVLFERTVSMMRFCYLITWKRIAASFFMCFFIPDGLVYKVAAAHAHAHAHAHTPTHTYHHTQSQTITLKKL